MSIRIALVALISAALLSSCSSSSDVRPEVARPLDEARVLANGGSDKAAIMAKLNQAASVPNLNKDERHQIRAIGEYALARPVNRYVVIMPLQSDAGPAGGNGVGYTGLH